MASEHDYGCPLFGCFLVPYSVYMLCTILNSTQNQSYVSWKTLLCAQDNVGYQFHRPMSLLPLNPRLDALDTTSTIGLLHDVLLQAGFGSA